MNEKLDELIQKYRLMLCRLAFVYVKNISDAEDIVQDVFVYILAKNVEFHDEEHERAWLIRTTIHRSLNVLKKRSRKEISLEEVLRSSMQIPSQTSEEAERSGDVLEAVLSLPVKYKSILHLYYFEGYHQEEIACMLDLPLSTVKTRMVRGRKRLKNILKEEFGYEG